jgi:hypothetical protein
MATTKAAPFEELTRLASDFVTSQKGMWDHKAWIDFLSHVQQQGIEVSDEMHAKLGELLEAMKEYHAAVSSREEIEEAMNTVLNESMAFIKRQKGVWGHAEWEDFVKTVQQNSRTWSEGMEAYLGGVLESLKVFYQVTPAAPVEEAAQEAPAAPPEEQVTPIAPVEEAAQEPQAVPPEESAPAAPGKASPKPNAAKTSEQSGKKKSSGA